MIVKELIEKAMIKAQGAQASLSRSESTDVSFENDKLKAARSSQSTQMSVKVIVDGKVGSSHTTDVNDVDGVVVKPLECQLNTIYMSGLCFRCFPHSVNRPWSIHTYVKSAPIPAGPFS